VPVKTAVNLQLLQ